MKKQILYLFIAFASCLMLTFKTNAQVASIPFAASLDTFTVITGTTIDMMGVDDVVYNNLPIGFSFSFGGVLHDKMSVSTNGNIVLDTIGTNMFVQILDGPHNNNMIAPFAADLRNSTANSSLQYATFGTAPNRVCIVQWLHYSYFAGNGDVSFQVQLFETSNCIRFIYGANTLVSNPLQTQIGLRGDTISDFIALGDTACNWAAGYPYPSIHTLFPVSLSCNMPSGFAYHFGACGSNNGVKFGSLTGKVFNDVNGNGIMDTTEQGIANHVVNLMPGNYYVSTDAVGSYAFFFVDSTLTYSLSTGGITYWNQTTVPAILSCNPMTQNCKSLDFGFQQIPNVHEVSITCPNWGAKPGQPEPMPIFYQNNGTASESDTITFEMDSLYSFISSTPAPVSISGQTLKWAYTNLLPNHGGSIMLHLLPSAAAVLGNYLNSTLTIAPLNDTLPTNNVLSLHQLLSNAWDPNEKLAEPSGMIAVGTTINYTIHFQNTGNAAAANITVRDVLDTNLDLLSFRLNGASHPVNFTMEGNGTAVFTFYNIQLPDSGTDFAASNGYVSFSIKTKSALAPLTTINNLAGIIFDSNPAVLTNTTTNIIQSVTGINNIVMYNSSLVAYPNPTSGNVTFVFSSNVKEKGNLEISNVEGKILLNKNNISSGESIDISGFADGIYICTVKSTQGTQMVKMVKGN